MDEAGALDPTLPALFELGLMGIEIPEEYGGAGACFFNAILAVEALAVVDPASASSSTCRTRWSPTPCSAGRPTRRRSAT